jgi:DnaJ-class molecular chaperone
VLSVARDATEADIRHAYRTKALLWHPDKHAGKARQQAEVQFREVAEAFVVLSDPRKRGVYDKYGELALKQGLPEAKEETGEGWTFNQSPQEVFSDFFGSDTPFAVFENKGPGLLQSADPTDLRQTQPVVTNLYCSLEELFLGCTKRVKATRNRLLPDGRSVAPESRVLAIQVEAGWRAGTKVTFPGEGDEAPGMRAGDLVYVIQEKPHPRYARQGRNLIYNATVSLRDALTGGVVEVPTLDGRVLPVPLSQVVQPGSRHLVPGEGMRGAGGARGDLVVHFSVSFPAVLSEESKERLRRILPA